MLVASLLVAGLGAATAPAAAAPSLPRTPPPTVVAAPSVGTQWNASPVDLGADRYREAEYFFAGDTSVGPYTSRMIVRAPQDARRFNGTVIVEWLNASAGSDIDVDFLPLLDLITREGYAYVGVTAQQSSVDFLRNRDPQRYGALSMAETLPAQPAAFEVFSQAGTALRHDNTGVDPLGGLRARHLIATGQSQSSARLTTYVNTMHDVTMRPVYDAFLLHAGGGAVTRFNAPTVKLNSENEAPGYYGLRGTANPLYRYWEVPGSAHGPLESHQYTLDTLEAARGQAFPPCPYPYSGPGGPVSAGPVVRSAVSYLDRWVRTGKPAPQAPLIDMAPSPSDPAVGVIQRDQYGNALGGIRLPQQAVPTGRNLSGSAGCGPLTLFPGWDPFDGNADAGTDANDIYREPASAKALYRNHGTYVAKFAVAAFAAQRAGFLLPRDATAMIREAAASDVAR